MPLEKLKPDAAQSIIEHMNRDHGETLANYVRYYGGVNDVISAELIEITNHEMYIDTVAHSLSCRLAIQLVQPVKNASEARAVLVEMAKQSRDGLRKSTKDKDEP